MEEAAPLTLHHLQQSGERDLTLAHTSAMGWHVYVGDAYHLLLPPAVVGPEGLRAEKLSLLLQ